MRNESILKNQTAAYAVTKLDYQAIPQLSNKDKKYISLVASERKAEKKENEEKLKSCTSRRTPRRHFPSSSHSPLRFLPPASCIFMHIRF